MTDRNRLQNGLPIRRPRKTQQQKNDYRLQKCCDKYDDGEYTRMQFLRAVSHSIMHTQPVQIQDDGDDESDSADNAADEDTANVTTCTNSSATSDRCEVCLLQRSSDVALVPCGHSRFCATCADSVASMDSEWLPNMHNAHTHGAGLYA